MNLKRKLIVLAEILAEMSVEALEKSSFLRKLKQFHTSNKDLPLIKCRACGRDIAKEAKNCMNCGALSPGQDFARKLLAPLSFFLMVILLVFYEFTGNEIYLFPALLLIIYNIGLIYFIIGSSVFWFIFIISLLFLLYLDENSAVKRCGVAAAEECRRLNFLPLWFF